MNGPWTKAVAVILAVLLVAGLVLAVISNLSTTATPGPEAPRTPTTPERDADARVAPVPALQRFYDQTLDWRECDDRMVCASMMVPLDYAKPAGRTIALSVLKRYADRNRQGALVVNPGGPGASGTDYARRAGSFFRDPITDRFDIVGFDPRGTGESSPIDCLNDRELDEYVASDPDPDTVAERREFTALVRGFNAGCAASDLALASHVSTIEAARDIDILRAVLEEPELTYFGASYGTQLGATYADLFPDRAGRLVLDGGVDLEISSRQRSLDQARGFETALRAYVANCLELSDACFLGSDVDEGLARISGFLEDLDAEPLPVDDRLLTQGLAFYGIAAPLYDRGNWLLLTTGLRSALAGEGTVLLALADAYSSRSPGGSYSSNILEANIAINCLDDPTTAGVEEVLTEVPAFVEVAPTLGRTFAWSLIGCAGHEARSTEKPRTVTAAGAPPIVVVGTSRDPATPIEWSEALAAQLESGVLIRRDGDGHTGYNADNACVDTAVEDFLVEGTVPEDGLSC